MTRPSELRALAERVEAGSGEDRILDGDIVRVLDIKVRHHIGSNMTPRYSCATDAVIALIAERLPEIGGNCHGYDKDACEVVGYVSRNGVKSGHWHHEGLHKTEPARALLAALLRALAQHTPEGRQNDGETQ